jgi:hypothetical protein
MVKNLLLKIRMVLPILIRPFEILLKLAEITAT